MFEISKYKKSNVKISIRLPENMNEILRKRAESRMVFADGQEYQGQPVVLTEYGGIAFEEDNPSGWGYYGRVKDEEQFLERLRPITEFLLRSGKFSGFCFPLLIIEALKRLFSYAF
mgnify:CR=1 FL=1